MYPTVSAVVILLISFGYVYGQQCPNGSTTQLFVGDGSIPVSYVVPVCITCDFFINNALVNPTDFTWSRNPNSDNTPLTNGSFDGNVLITPDTRTLILVNATGVVSLNDIIRCNSPSNGPHLITIQSFVFTNPIISPNGTVDVIEGFNRTITCTDPGNTGNTRYQWFNSTGSVTASVTQNQVPLELSFTNIKRTDSGVYICRSTSPNILPGVNMDSNVTVNVQFKVEIISILPNATTVVIGSGYTVNCTYVSNPSPNVTWEHNGTVLESNEYITINTQSTYSELIISPLQGLQNGGNYLCKAQNILGNDTSSTVSLTVQVNPDPVIDLTAPTNDITTMSVRLTWSLGFNGNAVITGVTITYTAIGNNETPQTGVESFTGASAVEGTISNLQPFTNYTFEAVVMNDAGITSVPQTVVVQTLPLVPTPPTVDSVSPINSTSLRVTWTDNRNTFNQSIVTSYRLEYYMTGQTGTPVSVDMISSTSYDITGLNKGTNYTVRVYATNSAGESTTASNSVTNRTDVDPPSAVMGVLTTPYEYSICVSWSFTVADNGGQPLSSFRIYLRNEEEINNEYMLVTVLPPTVTSYRIENLMNSTEYSIIIAATNMEGGHGANTTYTTRTGNPIPEDQNITLTTSNITAFTALIQWEGTSNGQLILQYRSQGSEWSRDRQINVTGRTSYMLNSSLIPETSYEIRLIQSFVSNCLQRASPVRAFTTIMLQIIVSINGTNDRVTTIAGNEVTLECNLNTGGAPPSDVTWSNDKGEPIPPDVISGSNRLVFTSPTVSDSANYTCTFQNVSYTFELIIDPQPTAPPFVFPQFAIYIIAGVVGAIIIVFIIVLIIVCCCICRDKETKSSSSSKTYDFSKNKKGTGGMWLDGGASGLSPSNPSYRRTTEDYVDYPGGRGRSLTNEDTSSTSFIKNNRKEEEGSRERLTDDKYADLQFDSNAKPYAEQRVEYATVGHTSFTKHTDV